MEEDKLKIYWRILNKMSQNNEINMEMINKIFNDELKQTSLNRLAKRYFRFSVCAIIMSFVSLFYVQIPLFQGWIKFALCAYMSLYFIIASCMDYYLYNRIKMIDILTMNTSEVFRRLAGTKKLHFIFMAILLPLAIGLVIFLCLAFTDEKEVIYGLIFGAIIGLGIGIMKMMDFLRDYRNLLKQ